MPMREGGAMRVWWSRRKMASVAAVLVACSCSNNRHSTVKEPAVAPATTSAAAVTESTTRQFVPPGGEKTPPRSTGVLTPGESIWLRSGKSRVLQLKSPIKRVSIGDPDLAGIVVLGPRTVMLNAKVLPGSSGPDATAGTRTAGAVTARTLTPEPQFRETTLTLWDGGDAPDVH